MENNNLLGKKRKVEKRNPKGADKKKLESTENSERWSTMQRKEENNLDSLPKSQGSWRRELGSPGAT